MRGGREAGRIVGMPAEATSALARFWSLDPAGTFLNHGSFGACPRPVLEVQARLRSRMEEDPVRFLVRELEARLDEARQALGAFIGADPQDLVWSDGPGGEGRSGRAGRTGSNRRDRC